MDKLQFNINRCNITAISKGKTFMSNLETNIRFEIQAYICKNPTIISVSILFFWKFWKYYYIKLWHNFWGLFKSYSETEMQNAFCESNFKLNYSK